MPGVDHRRIHKYHMKVAEHTTQAGLQFILNKITGDLLREADAIKAGQDLWRRQEENTEEDRLMNVKNFAVIEPHYLS